MFSEEKFQDALAKPRLKQPLPEYLPGNRAGGKVRVISESELSAMTRQWFVEFDRKVGFAASGDSKRQGHEPAQKARSRPAAAGGANAPGRPIDLSFSGQVTAWSFRLALHADRPGPVEAEGRDPQVTTASCMTRTRLRAMATINLNGESAQSIDSTVRTNIGQ